MSANAWAIARVVWLQLVRRKDPYVLLVLLAALLFAVVSLDAFGLGSAPRYVADIGLLLAWLFAWILAIVVASRELPREETSGTIYSLLARPVTRWDVVVGKWLGAWVAVAAAAALFHLAVALTAWAMGGRQDVAAWAQGYLLHAALLAAVCAFAVLASTRLNADAAATLAWVLSAVGFLIVPRVPNMLVHQDGPAGAVLLALYHLSPHFDILDLRMRIVHDYGPLRWATVGGLVLYAGTWTGLFLFGAWWAYRNKRFSRDRLAV